MTEDKKNPGGKSLNPSQIKAIELTDGPVIIVAGAGTGKTTVITQKIKFLIERELAKPDEILALTFNEKAASEMQSRIDEIMDFGYLDMQISTFHALGQRLIEQYGLEIGLPNRFKIMTETDAWLMVRKNIHKFELNHFKPLANPTKYIREMIRLFSKCKDEMIGPEEYLDYAQNLILDGDSDPNEEKNRIKEIADAYHAYNRILLEHDALDFGDLIYYSNKLLDSRKNIQTKLSEKFKYILVDEFQDVNWAQYQLVTKLAGKRKNLTVVGDDDQSIYAFRGASVSNILRFKSDNPDAREVILNDNYRSDQNILDRAYELIQNNNPDRLEVKLKINKRLKSSSAATGGGSVAVSRHRTAESEAEFIAKEILRLKQSDAEATWDDFAVLVRANSHASQIVSAMERNGLPYEFLAASGLFRQPVVLDCFNFFKVITNYSESASVYRMLNLPFLNFNSSDMQLLISFSKIKSCSYYEALKRSAELKMSESGVAAAGKILKLINEGVKNARKDKPSITLYKFINDGGYLKYLIDGASANDHDCIRQIFALNQFFEYVTNYESITAGASVLDFLEYFENVIDSGDTGILKQPEETNDSINIMTVHTAKGLEYKYVFVVNLVEDRFPTRRRGEGIEIPDKLIKEQLPEGDSFIEEERRLLYVAMTRAKNKLYLTYADNYGGVRQKKPSRFLSEINAGAENLINESPDIINANGLINAQEKKLELSQPADMPNSFSFSQLQSYSECPYQYKMGQILKLPTAGSASLSFGLTIHNTLEKFYSKLSLINGLRQGDIFGGGSNKINDIAVITPPPIDELLDLYEKSWIADWYADENQRQLFYDKGKKMLKEYYQAQSGNWTVPVALETSFKAVIGGCVIGGRIDRIDKMPDGKLEIIDYKTGQSKEKIEGDDKDQLLIYQIALSQLPQFISLGQIGQLTYYYLDGNRHISFFGDEKDVKKIEEKILKLTERILNADFSPSPEKHTCSRCNYRDICDFRA